MIVEHFLLIFVWLMGGYATTILYEREMNVTLTWPKRICDYLCWPFYVFLAMCCEIIFWLRRQADTS